MEKHIQQRGQSRRKCPLSGAALGVCYAALMASSASAAVITNTKAVNFTSESTSCGYNGSKDFTFSDVSGGVFFNPTAVGVSTSGSGEVTFWLFFGTPDTYFDPVRGSGVLVFDGSSQFAALPSTTGIPYSATPFFIGLTDTTADGTHYGYGEFAGTGLVSYAFQSTPGVGLQAASAVSAVPLPKSAPMFGAALMVLGVVGYGLKRKAGATTG